VHRETSKLKYGCEKKIKSPLPYVIYFALQIHVNGFVSLGSPTYPPNTYPLYPASYPLLYEYYSRWYAVIAPFWTDIDLQNSDGVVYLSHVSRSSAAEYVTPRASELFEATRQLVVAGAGDTGFLPTQVITVTWQNVLLSHYWWWWWWWYYPSYWYPTQVRDLK